MAAPRQKAASRVFLLLLGPLLLWAFKNFRAGTSFLPTEGQAGRRAAVTAAIVAGQLAVVPEAQAEFPQSIPASSWPLLPQGWQVKLPRDWKATSTDEAPPPGIATETKAIVIAGNEELGGELIVFRAPLSTAPSDPNAPLAKQLISYFATPDGKTPPIKPDKAVEAVVESQKTLNGLIKFELLGPAKEIVKSGRRYIRYEYRSVNCPGVLERGASGDKCYAPEISDDPVPFYDRRHSITVTVLDEGTGAFAEAARKKAKEGGQVLPIQQTYYLWVLDVSAGPDDWEKLKDPVETVSDSFVVGNPDELEKERTVEVTPGQLELLKEAEKQGLLPKDEGL